MSSAVAELDSALSSMLALKAGVSGAKVAAITSLCNANVKDEPVLIQKLYAYFKKAEAHKKLGVLYVIDSVTRQWFEQAKKAGQMIGHGARDGTYAAAVTHVSELLPALMQDIISVAPEEQREKLDKLIKIWDQGGTFPPQMLQSFREKLSAPPVRSTTPTTTPPPQAILTTQTQQIQANPTQSTSSILASLQALAAASKGAAPPNAVPPPPPVIPTNTSNVLQFQPPAVVPGMPIPPIMSAVNSNSNAATHGGFPPPPPQIANMYNQGAQVPPPPPQAQGPPQDNALVQQQIMILQHLQSQGIPQSQWPQILAAITASTSAPVPPPNFVPNQNAMQNNQGYEGMRSPQGNSYGGRRSRSRSPRGRRDASPYGRRRSPDRNDDGRNRRSGRDNDTSGRRRSPSPHHNSQHHLPSSGPKWIDFDHSVPKGHIKVLSRTLFVGGVNCSDNELRQIFSQAGTVQTCITSTQKRHAFVKMVSRKDAEKAKEIFEHYKAGDMQLRTRWGVGFGPRDASDYQTGISIIAIDRLTDADKKWVLTAEYGGTGGREVESGMCMEEPDIEIGGGVSSKAISRRMQTDRSGVAGPRSSRIEDNQGGRRRNDTRGYQAENTTPTVQVPPTVPSFGFQLPPNFTMPQALGIPPGFPMPGAQQPSNNGS